MRPFRVFGDRDNSPELRGGERSGLGSDSSTHLDSALRSDDGNPEAIQRPEKSAAQNHTTEMLLRICGYSAGRPLSEVWEVLLQGAECGEPSLVRPEA